MAATQFTTSARSPRAGFSSRATPPLAPLPSRVLARTCAAIFWVAVALFTLFFVAYSVQRYTTFQMHALDMGNMDQAAWFTLHGQPFHFTNMRRHDIGIEAFGTDTRLSFHVEYLWLLLAQLYRIWAAPQMLLIVQVVVVASGAVPARRLALRHLAHVASAPLAGCIVALVYLLYPAVQAAVLYEFHPVTLAAAFLLWAIDLADARRYAWFAVAALLAMGGKEETGVVIGLLGLWIAWRNGDRSVGIFWMLVGGGWSLVSIEVIIPYFRQAPSPYWARFLADAGATTQGHVGPMTVLRYWIQHPSALWNTLTLSAKFGFLHRWLMPTGYLALLGGPLLLLAVPDLAIIMLSNDIHMYSGLAQYTIVLIPAAVVSSVWTVSWLGLTVAPRLRVSANASVLLLSLWLLIATLANARVNGFTPLAEGFAWPTQTAHDALAQQMLSLIPPTDSVSAQDVLNPHVGDRRDVYLFPDWQHLPLLVGHGVSGRTARWIALDMTTSTTPIQPADEVGIVRRILGSHTYGVAFARDGLLLLHRGQPGPYTLPMAFYSFVLPQAGQPAPLPPTHTLRIDYALPGGGLLELSGYRIDRREEVNLRVPDIVLTTFWHRLPPPHGRLSTAPVGLGFSLTNADGAITSVYTDTMVLDWLPIAHWPAGRTVVVQTSQMSVTSLTPGAINIDLFVAETAADGSWDASIWSNRIAPVVMQAAEPLETVQAGTVVQLDHVRAVF